MEKDQLAMAAAKMRKPTPTGSLALGSPPGLQPLIEGKEEGEEKEKGGESTSDPFDVSEKGPIYSLSLVPLTLSETPDLQRDPQYSCSCMYHTGGLGTIWGSGDHTGGLGTIWGSGDQTGGLGTILGTMGVWGPYWGSGDHTGTLLPSEPCILSIRQAPSLQESLSYWVHQWVCYATTWEDAVNLSAYFWSIPHPLTSL